MSVNQYTRLQWNRPYSMFVPRPFEELDRVGQLTQGRYNKGLQDISDTASMIHINADPKHIEHRDNLLNQYNSKISNLSDAFVKEGATPQNQMKLNSLKKQYANDPNRLQLESNYKNYLEYQKDAQKLSTEGKYDPINSEYDPYHHLQVSGDSVTPFNYRGMKPITDFYKPAHEMMASIKANGYDQDTYHFDEDGNIIGVKAGKESIARQDVNRVAASKVPLFLSHQDSRYFTDKFLSQHPNASKQDLQNAAYDYLRREGENQIFSKSKYSQDFNYAPKYIADAKQEAVLEGTSTQSEALVNNKIQDPTEGIEVNKDGTIKLPMTRKMTEKVMGKADKIGLVPEGDWTLDKDKYNNTMSIINGLRSNNPELKDLKDGQVLNAYRSAIKSIESESIPLQGISNLAAEGISKKLVRDLDQRNFYMWDSKGKTEDGTLKTILDKLDISQEDFEKQLKKGVAGYTQAGPTPGGYYVYIKDNDGESRRIMISPDDQMKTIFSTSKAINDSRKTLQPFTVESIGGYKIHGRPQISKDGSVKWEYLEDINGQLRPTTLDEVRKQEREALRESKYLPSHIEHSKDEEKDVD